MARALVLLIVGAAGIALCGCCKDDEEPVKPAETVASAAPTPTPEPTAEGTTTATVPTARYYDAGKVVLPEGGVFGGPPPIATDKRTATPPNTKQPPPDTTTFGGPPPIATGKRTASPPATKPPSTVGAFK